MYYPWHSRKSGARVVLSCSLTRQLGMAAAYHRSRCTGCPIPRLSDLYFVYILPFVTGGSVDPFFVSANFISFRLVSLASVDYLGGTVSCGFDYSGIAFGCWRLDTRCSDAAIRVSESTCNLDLSCDRCQRCKRTGDATGSLFMHASICRKRQSRNSAWMSLD